MSLSFYVHIHQRVNWKIDCGRLVGYWCTCSMPPKCYLCSFGQVYAMLKTGYSRLYHLYHLHIYIYIQIIDTWWWIQWWIGGYYKNRRTDKVYNMHSGRTPFIQTKYNSVYLYCIIKYKWTNMKMDCFALQQQQQQQPNRNVVLWNCALKINMPKAHNCFFSLGLNSSARIQLNEELPQFACRYFRLSTRARALGSNS